jgi:hypothetical protein
LNKFDACVKNLGLPVTYVIITGELHADIMFTRTD